MKSKTERKRRESNAGNFSWVWRVKWIVSDVKYKCLGCVCVVHKGKEYAQSVRAEKNGGKQIKKKVISED